MMGSQTQKYSVLLTLWEYLPFDSATDALKYAVFVTVPVVVLATALAFITAFPFIKLYIAMTSVTRVTTVAFLLYTRRTSRN